MSSDALRAGFEAWAKQLGWICFHRIGADYINTQLNSLWHGYQACAAACAAGGDAGATAERIIELGIAYAGASAYDQKIGSDASAQAESAARDAFITAVRAVPPLAGEGDAKDAARYRALFTIEDFCREPLWPVVEWMRGSVHYGKEDVDAALDAAMKAHP